MVTVQLDWCVAAEAADALLDESLHWLDPAEHARLERLARPAARREFLLGRWLLRRALARSTGRPPQEWRFAPGRHGRPQATHPDFAPERPPPDVNLSHGGGIAIVALCDAARVGVDVESSSRRLPVRRLERFLSAVEHADLMAVAERDRPERFWRLWTLKEAYLKAVGTGIAGSLGSFAVRLRDPAAPLLEGPTDAELWRLFEPSLEPGIRAGLAVRLHSPGAVAVAVARVSQRGSA